jgi:hypothetical protein
LRTDLTSDRCLLTKIDFNSCVDQNGNDFLKSTDSKDIVYFCNERSVFTVFEIPKLDEKRSYGCYVSVIPYGGTETGEQLSLNLKGSGYSKLVVEKEILKPGEKFLASATNSQIFTDYGEYAYESGEFTAPNYDFKIYSYNSGYLDSKSISVVMEKPIDVYLDVNGTLAEGKAALVNVRVVNLLDKTQQIKVVFRKDSYSEELTNSKYFVFNFTPSINDNLVQVFVSTPDFSTSVSKAITVIGQKNALEDFFKPIIDFFDWLFSLFK